MKKYHLYIFGALSLSGFLHQLSCNYSNGCRKVLAKYVFCCGLRAHNPECSVTSFYSVKESACHLQQHKKLLAMHIAWMKVLVLNFSKFQIIFPWPFLCFIPKKNSIFLSLAEVSLRGFPSWIACCCVPELQIP